MTKTKTPFFGLGSKGSIAGTLTSQKHAGDTLLRAKPTPANPRSLPQTYQRWLYEDYAYLWRQQTTTTKRSYSALGVPHHLTGFQYWMKYNLTHLPDIAAIYHFDTLSGALLTDFSRSANHATIFGASPVSGIIDHALHFDGINDYAIAPDSLTLQDILSFECFYKPASESPVTPGIRPLLMKDLNWLHGLRIESDYTPDQIRACFWDGATSSIAAYSIPAYGVWYHVVGQFETTRARLYIQGVFVHQGVVTTGHSGANADPLYIGGELPNRAVLGALDHAFLRTRTLDATEILRNSLRRYPLQ